MLEDTRKEVSLKQLVELAKKFKSRTDFTTWVNAKYLLTRDRARMIHSAITSGNMDMAEDLYKDITQEWNLRKEFQKQYEIEEQKRFEERQEEERAVKQMRKEIHEIHGILTDWYKHYLSRQ
jgi:hypothetical protein